MRTLISYIAVATLLAACSDSDTRIASSTDTDLPPLTVSDMRLTKPMSGMSMGAGYLTLSNNSEQDIRITRVDGIGVDSVDMHESILEDGISRMEKLPQIEIPAGQSVLFEPGAKHLMLRYPDETPSQVTLQFFSGDDLLLDITTAVAKD